MRALTAKLTRIGNSRGIRIPAELIRRHRLEKGVLLEEHHDHLRLKAANGIGKLSWEETARQMALEKEDWTGWASVHPGWRTRDAQVGGFGRFVSPKRRNHVHSRTRYSVADRETFERCFLEAGLSSRFKSSLFRPGVPVTVPAELHLALTSTDFMAPRG